MLLSYFKRSSRVVHAVPDVASPALEQDEAADAGSFRQVTTDIGGKPYRIESDDNYLDHIRGVFEPHMVQLFDSLVKPSDTVLDVGANIGCTSILFGSRARQVVSFEPSPTTFSFLKKNLAAAGLNNVTPLNLGLGKTAGRFELTFSADNRSGGFVSNKVQASAGHRVEAIDIAQGDTFVKGANLDGVDFIKIDVEGFERDVIEGLRDTLSTYEPTVTLELNHWCLNVFQRIPIPDFFDFLRGVFPYLYAVEVDDIRDLHNVDDAYHVMYHHVVGGFKYPNIVGAFDPARLQAFGSNFGRTIS
jgi:FkbM family methyltransferase